MSTGEMNLRPRGFRANGRLLRCTKHTEIVARPIIKDGEHRSSIVGMEICVTGLKGEPEDGRCDWWVPRWEREKDGPDHRAGYWYFHYEHVAWLGMIGTAERRDGHLGGFLAVDKRLQGLRDYNKLMQAAS